jgi:hypothetical protein
MNIIRSIASHTFTYLLVGSLAMSQPLPLSADVTPTAVANQYSVSLNSDAGWDLNAELNNLEGRYKIGEKLDLRFCSPSKDCYVHIFNIAPDGKTTLIWPNDYCPDNKVTKATAIQFPTPGSNLTFRARAPIGKELLVLLATERPLNLRERDQTTKLAEFLDAAKAKSQAAVSSLRSFMVEREKPFGWAGKVIEITTCSDTEASQSSTPKPQVYRPGLGEFSVQAVGEFKQSKGNNGVTTHFHSDGTTAYSVAHTTLSGLTAAEAPEVLQRLKEAQKKELQGTVQSEQSITVPGGIGIEVTVRHRLNDRNWLTMSRIVSVGQNVYLITVSAAEYALCKSTAEEFLQSLAIQEPGRQLSKM